jgi:hypothetical protein
MFSNWHARNNRRFVTQLGVSCTFVTYELSSPATVAAKQPSHGGWSLLLLAGRLSVPEQMSECGAATVSENTR